MENRRWLLASHPTDHMSDETFARDDKSGLPAPVEGCVLMRNILVQCAPTIRNWITGNASSYYPTVEVGQPVLAPCVGVVVESDNPDWPVGTRATGLGSWQDFQWVDPAMWAPVPENVSSEDIAGPFGMNAMTAYFGLLRVGLPKEGETLLVSGAAGSVGSIVAQIGRIVGCKTVGICGSEEKARWLREECAIEHVINYRDQDIGTALDEICPEGIDVFFDNVGGETLRTVVKRMNRGGRISLCGQISGYDEALDRPEPPLDMMRIIYGGIRLEGFLVSQFAAEFPDAIQQMAQWMEAGVMKHRMDIPDGFDRLPQTFAALFDGSNEGTLLARIADADGNPL